RSAGAVEMRAMPSGSPTSPPSRGAWHRGALGAQVLMVLWADPPVVLGSARTGARARNSRWSEKSCPEAVRALLVAVDDHGDYLGYLLRADSSTELDDTLMHFHHETAAVT